MVSEVFVVNPVSNRPVSETSSVGEIGRNSQGENKGIKGRIQSIASAFIASSADFFSRYCYMTEGQFDDYVQQGKSIVANYIPRLSLNRVLDQELLDEVANLMTSLREGVDLVSGVIPKKFHSYVLIPLGNILAVHSTRFAIQRLIEVSRLDTLLSRSIQGQFSSRGASDRCTKALVGSLAAGCAVLALESVGKVVIPKLTAEKPPENTVQCLEKALGAGERSEVNLDLVVAETSSELAIAGGAAFTATNCTSLFTGSPYMSSLFSSAAAIYSLTLARHGAKTNPFSFLNREIGASRAGR